MKFISAICLCLRIVLFLLLFVISACHSGSAKKPEGSNKDSVSAEGKQLPFLSGRIEYAYRGGYEGKQTVSFRAFGDSFRVEDEYTNMASPLRQKTHTVLLRLPEEIIFVNLEKKLGYRISRKDTFYLRASLLRDILEMGLDSAMQSNGYRPSAEAKVAGKVCRVYSGQEGKSRFCFWNNINIRTEISLGENFSYTLEATKIDEKVLPSVDLFVIPADVRILEYKAYLKEAFKY